MKKRLLSVIATIAFISIINAQIGVNTNTPSASLDIVAKATTTTEVDGILVPRLTVAELSAKDTIYTTAQEGTLVYITSGTGSIGKTINITGVGFYYYDSVTALWKPLSAGGSSFKLSATTVNAETVNWASLQAFNYFEVTTGVSSMNFPNPNLFTDKTIYIRNAIGGNLSLNSPSGEMNGLLPSLTTLSATSAIEFYSDGTRWYQMAGRF